MNAKVSVVTPSLNQGRFVGKTIESVLSQDVADLEYIIVDGGSCDRTIDVVRGFRGRIRWLCEKDKGQADAVNKGIRKTSGELIGWLNSDDVYYEGAIARIVDFFDRNRDVDIVYGEADHIDENDRVIEPYPTEEWDYETLMERCFVCQPAVFFRRRLVERFGYLDDRLQYCMDYEYWLRIGKTMAFAKLDAKLAGSRLYMENKTLGQRVAVHEEINDMMKRKFGRVPSKWIFSYSHSKVDRKGYDRSNGKENLKYTILLVLHSLMACLRWNRKVLLRDAIVMANWLAGAVGR